MSNMKSPSSLTSWASCVGIACPGYHRLLPDVAITRHHGCDSLAPRKDNVEYALEAQDQSFADRSLPRTGTEEQRALLSRSSLEKSFLLVIPRRVAQLLEILCIHITEHSQVWNPLRVAMCGSCCPDMAWQVSLPKKMYSSGHQSSGNPVEDLSR